MWTVTGRCPFFLEHYFVVLPILKIVRGIYPATPTPIYKRYINIINTKLRHTCLLNYDLFRHDIIDSYICSCEKEKDVYHLFFVCRKYSNAWNKKYSFQ